jgi:hypothetical protein
VRDTLHLLEDQPNRSLVPLSFCYVDA